MIVSEYKLPYTGAEVQEKLDAIGEGSVTAGTYGGYTSSSTSPYYYIPNITINDQGIITAVSKSYLGTASSKSAGIMTSDIYSHIDNYIVNVVGVNCPIDGSNTATLSSMKGHYVSAGFYVPKIIGVYARLYIDSAKTTQYIVPIDTYYTSVPTSASGSVVLTVTIPEKYKEFNSGTINCFALYNKSVTTTSSH